jgi:hypothetical protein
MQKLGGYLLFFGIGSIILDFIGMRFVILSWIDTWGPSIGWTIRIGLIVAGAAILLVERKKAAASA